MIKDELLSFCMWEIRGKNEIHSNLGESHFCAISIPAEKPEMAKRHESLTTEFILKGLTDASSAEDPSVSGVSYHLSSHYGGQSWSGGIDFYGTSSSHFNVHLPG